MKIVVLVEHVPSAVGVVHRCHAGYRRVPGRRPGRDARGPRRPGVAGGRPRRLQTRRPGIAARVAVRLDAGIVSDVIDVRMGDDGPVAVQSVLDGSYLVESTVVRDVAVFTVRTEAVESHVAPVKPTVRDVDVPVPDRQRAARLVGRVVRPPLDLALGVSGSARHRAAIRDAGTVVAVDIDPAAPILGIADLAVVGDVHQVVPELLAEIRRRRSTIPTP